MNAVESLDVLARRSLDRIASAAAVLLDVPLVLISTFDGSNQVNVGSHGLRVAGPSSLCREVASTGRPSVIQDVRRRRPATTHAGCGFELVGYAGVALKVSGPSRVGALAVFTPERRVWQGHDLDILRSLADAAAAVLDMLAGCEAIVNAEKRGAADQIEIASANGRTLRDLVPVA